jgi:hypothetical protein
MDITIIPYEPSSRLGLISGGNNDLGDEVISNSEEEDQESDGSCSDTTSSTLCSLPELTQSTSGDQNVKHKLVSILNRFFLMFMIANYNTFRELSIGMCIYNMNTSSTL